MLLDLVVVVACSISLTILTLWMMRNLDRTEWAGMNIVLASKPSVYLTTLTVAESGRKIYPVELTGEGRIRFAGVQTQVTHPGAEYRLQFGWIHGEPFVTAKEKSR